MNKYFKVFIFFSLIFLGFFLLGFLVPGEAQVGCDPQPDNYCNLACEDLVGYPDPDCDDIGDPCVSGSCGSLSTTSYCCNTGSSCSPGLGENCDTIPAWTYCYDPVCKVVDWFECNWSWSFATCGLPDTCDSAEPKLKAGRCDTGVYQCKPGTPCWVGGVYKTCCQTDGSGNLTGNP